MFLRVCAVWMASWLRISSAALPGAGGGGVRQKGPKINYVSHLTRIVVENNNINKAQFAFAAPTSNHLIVN